VTPAETAIWWSLAAVGLGGSMLCSGMETGLYASNSVRAMVRARGPNATSADRVVASALDRPDIALTTLLLFNNGFNYLATLAITALLVSLGLSDAALILLQAAVLTPVLLVFAESLPKELFRAHAERMTRRFAPALRAMRLVGLVTGLVPLIAAAARLGGRLIGIDASRALRSPRERTAELIKHGSEQLSDAQANLVDRALRIETTSVRDEMVPLHAAAIVRGAWVAARARAEIARRPHARYPVLDDRGRAIGIVRLADLVRQPGATVASLMTDCPRLEHTTSAWDALGELRRLSSPIALIVRNGHAVGMVTQKDLVEPLTGDLRDW
jgi:putative hemolysin